MSITGKSFTSVFPMDSEWELDDDGQVSLDPDTGLPVADRAYNASDLRDFFSLLVTDGVYTDFADELLPVLDGGSWYVSQGAAVASGLLIPVRERVKVCDQADVTTGQYAYICVAAQFDSDKRCGEVYARLSTSAQEQPVRTESTHELILARVNWRGEMTDLRLDNSSCGPVQFVAQVDTDSFMASLFTALSQFNLNVGDVESLPSGSTPTVEVRKPEQAGGEVYIDFGIPRGAPGEPGKSAAGVYVQEDRPVEPEEGAVWMGTNPDTRQIEQIEVYELTGTYPDEFYPDEAYPDGTVQWAAYTIDPALVTGAQS